MKDKFYWLLDSRAWTAEHHEMADYVICGDGSAEVICADANEGDYGNSLVITDNDFNIMYDWICDNGKWNHLNNPKP